MVSEVGFELTPPFGDQKGEGSGTFRRNRRDIIAVPSENEAAQREGDGHIPAARDDGAVFTRYGRQVKAPDQLNL